MESKLLMMRFVIHTKVVNLQKKEADFSASFFSFNTHSPAGVIRLLYESQISS